LSISELRKTGNELQHRTGRIGHIHSFTGSGSRILHKGWCNKQKFHDLANLAWQRGPVRVLVSIPFRDV
jgi:hypothetical protein